MDSGLDGKRQVRYMKNRRIDRQRCLTALLSGLFSVWFFCGSAFAEQPVSRDSIRIIPLHPLVGDVLDHDEALQWGLFQDLPELQQAVFHRAAWGGFLADITVKRQDGLVILRRNIQRARWDMWRARIDAGLPIEAEDFLGAAADSNLVWPEAPPPQIAADSRDPIPTLESSHLKAKDWALLLDLGYKHSTTDFNNYFTDMLLMSFGVGKPVTDHLMPTIHLQIGQGDLVDDFEALTGDGRSAVYALEGALRIHTGFDKSRSAYLAVGGGYYMRSLRWGGEYFSGYTGYYQSGSLVREFSDWGGHLRTGLQLFKKSRSPKPKYLDISVRYEFYEAERNVLTNTSGETLYADDRDSWLGVSIGIVIGI
jgi:hypothetical protein